MRRPLIRSQRGDPAAGLSLVEVLVAIVVLSIATLGLFGVFGQSVHTLSANRDRVMAGLVARNRAEELQAGLSNLPQEINFAGRLWTVSTETDLTSGGFEQLRISVSPRAGGATVALTVIRMPGGAG